MMFKTGKQGNCRKSMASETTLMFLIIIIWAIAETEADCIRHIFYPCSCLYDSQYDFYEIQCDGVSMSVVATIFRSKPPLDIADLRLGIRDEGDLIPADLLGESRLAWIDRSVYGAQLVIDKESNSISNETKPWLIIEPNAFRSSKQSSNSSLTAPYSFFMRNLDASRTDLQFLSDLDNLISIVEFDGLLNFERSLPTLPPLPQLVGIRFVDLDLNNLFPDGIVLNCNGLGNLEVHLYEDNPKVSNEGMSQMMNWLLPSSANTLEYLTFVGEETTSLTRTPPQLGGFKNFRRITIKSDTTGMTLAAGSIFSSQVEYLVFPGGTVVNVGNGAFQGDFSMTFSVDLRGPNLNSGQSLTRFEAGAFKSLLEQMEDGVKGKVILDGNKFDCYSDPCHLAWLCRDSRSLLSRVSGARCNGDGETFEEIRQDYFSNCGFSLVK